MSTPPPASPGLLEKVSRFLPRLLLGLFVLGQAVFLVAYNIVDMKAEAHEYLEKSRKKYQVEGDRKGGWAWGLIRRLPAVKKTVAEWLDAPKGEKRDKTTIGAAYVWVGKRTTWWARKAKQEQSWALFAPYVVDWCCFPSLELVWDGGKGKKLRSVTLLSDNEPRDKTRFTKWGHFRLRRYENLMDVEPIHVEADGAALTPEQKDELGDRMARRVRNSDDNILAYMRWRVRHYLEEHPGVDEPTAVILHTRGWIIPSPPDDPAGRFRGWYFAGDYPVARSQIQPDGKYAPLEVYVPRHDHFKKLEK